MAPAALALVVQLSARVLAVLALVASAQVAQAHVVQALVELVQAALVALVALAQVGLAALGFAAVVPKLLPVYGLAPCWLWPGFGPLTCSLSCFGSVSLGRLADWAFQKLCHPRLPTTRDERHGGHQVVLLLSAGRFA